MILVVGALHLDVVVRAPRLPRLDETLMGEGVAYRLGGKGGNQAVAAARLGARVAMAGCVGDDDFGARMRADLAAAGVDTAQLRSVQGASGMSVAIVEAAGDYGAVVVSGANRALDAADIALPADLSVLVLQNEVPEPVNIAVAQAARALGARVILNAAPARAPDPALLAAIDVLVVNRVEAAALRGAVPDTAPPGPAVAIVTRGADGLTLYVRGQAPRDIPARDVTQISAHGAGDVFVGALAADLADGQPLQAAVCTAMAAGAWHVAAGPDRAAELSRSRLR